MKRINRFLKHNPKYKRFQKPLKAAKICEAARKISRHRFGVISFKNGLLTLACNNSAEAANLQAENPKIMAQINAEIGENAVEKIRFKII